MQKLDENDWSLLADVFALCGNLLLTPMNQTDGKATDPIFWEHVSKGLRPECKDAAIGMARWCRQADSENYESLAQMVGVEYAKLFIGPPKPLAPPWETMYVNEDAQCGFGEPTFAMRELLREYGFEMSGASNQYEDHLGIELLFLSALCQRATQDEAYENAAITFAKQHPSQWITAFSERCEQAAHQGYYHGLCDLIQAGLRNVQTL